MTSFICYKKETKFSLVRILKKFSMKILNSALEHLVLLQKQITSLAELLNLVLFCGFLFLF